MGSIFGKTFAKGRNRESILLPLILSPRGRPSEVGKIKASQIRIAKQRMSDTVVITGTSEPLFRPLIRVGRVQAL